MKFRAQIGSAKQLSSLVGSLSKLGDSCLAHFSSTMIQFAVSAESEGVRAHADVNPMTLFLTYRIESKAAENRISFFVKLDNLQRALKTASAQGSDTSVKLTKKGGAPMLTFEVKMTDAAVDVQHDLVRSELAHREHVDDVHHRGRDAAPTRAGVDAYVVHVAAGAVLPRDRD